MAVAARQVHIAAGKDHVVGVEREVVIDHKRGIAAEVEKVTVAVDLGDGNVAVAQQHRVRGVAAVPTTQQNRPAITYGQSSGYGYAGMKTQVQEAKRSSSNQGSFAVKFCDIICGSIACLVCFVVLAALPIAMLVIGSIYVDDCAGQRLIPIWLIVFGCVSLVQTAINIGKRCCCRSKKDGDNDDSDFHLGRCCGNCLEFLMTLFLVGWIIAGSVWVFSNYSDYRQDNFECNSVPFIFSFVTLIIIYVAGLAFCLCFCCCFCIMALAADGDDSN